LSGRGSVCTLSPAKQKGGLESTVCEKESHAQISKSLDYQKRKKRGVPEEKVKGKRIAEGLLKKERKERGDGGKGKKFANKKAL